MWSDFGESHNMTWDLDMCLSDFVINLEPRRKNYNKVTISSTSKDAGKYLKANFRNLDQSR